MRLQIISTIFWGFASMSTSTMIVKNRINNFDIPICKNCIHFIPNDSDSDYYMSTLSKCSYSGTKDIITGVVNYEFASSCRMSENNCGVDAKYFEAGPNVEMKFFLLTSKRNIIPWLIIVTVPGFLLLLVDFIGKID